MRTKNLFLISALLVPLSSTAAIYKYVDSDGITHYTNQKPQNSAYRILNMKCLHQGMDCPGGKPVDWHSIPLFKTKYHQTIRHASKKHGVDEALIKAVIHAESSFNPKAVSSAGAQGLMQLMPATQQRFKVVDPFQPKHNIEGGVRYLALLLKLFEGNSTLASAAYHAGEGAVKRHGGKVPPYSSTKEYVRRVRILRERYRRY